MNETQTAESAENKRRYSRLTLESTVFVEVLSGGVSEEEAGQVIKCKSADLSEGGLRIAIDREVAAGAILHIGADIPGVDDTLFLAAEVKWCRASDDGRHWLGFELIDASDSDIDSWMALMKELK